MNQCTVTFAGWLAEGQEGAEGKIVHVHASGRGLLIKPDQFPEEILFASTADWPVSKRQQRLFGLRVTFDVKAQPVLGDRNATAQNLRFEDSARNGGGNALLQT